MTQICTVPPTVLAVTLDQAKANMRIDSADLDDLITTWIEGITSELEHQIGQCLMPQTWEVTLDAFAVEIQLPHPVISVASVSYLDESGAEVTLDSAAYRINRKRYATSLTAVAGTSWPPTYAETGAVIVTVVCGHGATAASTPKNVQLYILAKLVEQFDPITRSERDTIQSVFVDRLLDACKTYA